MGELSLEHGLNRLRWGLLNVALKWGEGIDRQGKPYEWMLDTRELLLQGPYLQYAARLLWERVKGYRPVMVGGMTLAANPLTIALMYESRADGTPVDAFLIRREPKGDGLRKLVEGPPIRSGTRVVLLDDLVNMGETQRKALSALEPFDCEVAAVGVIIDYQRKGTAWLRERGIPVEAIFTLGDLGIARKEPVAPQPHRLLWSFPGLNAGRYKAPKSSPRVVGDTIYVGSDQGDLLALSLNGEERWRYVTRDRERGIHSTPLVHGGTCYFGSYDGYLYAVDAARGTLVWEIRPGQWIGSSPTVDPEQGAIFAGIEYGKHGGSLIAVDAATGRLRWEMKAQGYIHSSPWFDLPRRQVVVGGNDGTVYAADARTGEIRWVCRTGGEVKGNPVIDQDGRVYFGSYDGYLYAARGETGLVVWRRRLGHRLYATPLVWNDLVIVGGFSGRLVALERGTGEVRWVAATGGPIVGGAALVGENRIVAGSQDKNISLFDVESGDLLWEHKADSPVMTTPGTGAGMFLVPSISGTLYAFEA